MARALEAVDAALDALDGSDGSMEDFRAASELADGLVERGKRAGALRRRFIAMIRDREQLKLVPLAERVGVSKARAHQLLSGVPAPAKKKKAPKGEGDA